MLSGSKTHISDCYEAQKTFSNNDFIHVALSIVVQIHIQYILSFAKNGDHHEAKFTYRMQMMILKSLEKNVFDAHAVYPSGVAVIVEKVRVLFM